MQRPLSRRKLAKRRFREWRPRRGYALLVGIVAALGLTGLSAAPALAAPTPGNVTGTISVPAGTASPADVQVALVAPDGSIFDSTEATGTPGSTTGTYSFSGEAPGQYYLYFYDTTTGDNVQRDYYGDGGVDNITAAALITVSAGGTTTVANEALGAGATISGAIGDANSTIESYADVQVDPVYTGADPDPLWNYGDIAEFEDVTGASSYTLSGLPAGTYRVEYYAAGTNVAGIGFYFDVYVSSSSGVTYDQQSGTEYPVAAATTTSLNISVPALGEVSGTVSGPNGPVYNDEVDIYTGLESLGDWTTYTDTAGDGTYSILLLPGTYKVDFDGLEPLNLASTWYGGATQAAATGVAVTAGGTSANINATLGSGATISGTVAAGQGGAALGGLDVELLDAQGNDIEDVFSQPDGTYTLTDVPAGTWYVEFNGGIADNGQYYASEFYGGKQSEFGATAITTTAGQAVTGINGALLPAGTAALGLPKTSASALSGLHNDKVALRFKVAAGAGAGYLQKLTVGLPKHFSWNRKKLKADLSLGAGVTFTDVITGGKLVVTLTNGEPAVSFSLKAGGITVTKAIEKAAGGVTTKKKAKKKKKALALAAKAKKTAKPKDTIKTETINLAVADTTGVVTSLPIVIKKPH